MWVPIERNAGTLRILDVENETERSSEEEECVKKEQGWNESYRCEG